ncbi:MAG: DUF6438 domain-containing protein [Rhizomicrobium sp.]
MKRSYRIALLAVTVVVAVPLLAVLIHARFYPQRPFWPVTTPDVRDWSTVKIRLSRSTCLGICSDYSIEISGNGTAQYEGRHFVSVTGKQQIKIPPQDVHKLFAAFQDADFLWFRNHNPGCLDTQVNKLTLSYDGRSKTITYDDCSAPPLAKLIILGQAVDQAANTKQWIGTGPIDAMRKLGVQ